MITCSSSLSVAHLMGLPLGVGSATVKVVLLLKSRADSSFLPVYINVVRPTTRQIVLGMILMTLSGIGWLILGYQFTALLMVKVVLVAGVWVLGPIIDNVVELKFQELAPGPGDPPSPAFLRVQKQYVALEVIATIVFYVVIVPWVRR